VGTERGKPSKETLRAFLESSREPMGILDLEGNPVWVNRAWVETLGAAPPEGAPRYEPVHPEDRERILRGWGRVARGELEGGEIQFRHRTAQGEYATFQASARRVQVDGQPLLCITAHDITERTQAEEALRAGEARYRRLADNAYDLIAETDEQGRFLYVSPRFGDITGSPPEELIGRTAFDLVHADDRPQLARAFEKLVKTGTSRQPQFRSRHRDGTWRWIESTARRYRTPSGEVRTVVISRDVTERVAYQEELRITNERLQTTLSSAPVFLLALDGDGIVTLCQGKSLKLVGIEPDKVVGRPISDLFTDEPQVRDLICIARTGEEGAGVIAYHDRVLEIRSTPIRTQAGTSDGVIAVATDITERTHAEEERARMESRMMASQKLESLGVLAGGIAHDFNNLLTSILGHSDLVLADLPPGSPVQDSAERIREASLRAVDLTNQMLAYAGQGRVEIQALDLSRLVETIVHLLKVSISKKAVLSSDLAGELPAVEGDPGQLTQVVLNLITNASEALGDKPGQITVRTGRIEVDRGYLSRTYLHADLPEGPYVYLEVSDTGAGMDPETKSKIFDPFFSTKFTGRGLGLAVLLGITRAHHGTISVDSEPEQGTTFRVLLPASDREARISFAASASQTSWQGSGTVLVVDDEAEVREVVKAMAPRFGLQVITAHDGSEAVRLFRARAEEIVAVLLDMTMPEMTGEEVLRALRRIRQDVPVVLMTGYSEEYALSRFPERGALRFLKKPFTIEGLRSTIRELLGPPAVS
jgi:PAS domain S-box-containing protein